MVNRWCRMSMVWWWCGVAGLRCTGLVGWRGAGNWIGWGLPRRFQCWEATPNGPEGPGQNLLPDWPSDNCAVGIAFGGGTRRAREEGGNAPEADGGVRLGRTITARSGETQTHKEGFWR